MMCGRFIKDNPKWHLNYRCRVDIRSFNMERFTKGVMWIMQEVFGLGEEHLFSESSVGAGEYMSFRIISYESRLMACYSSNVILSLVWMV